MDFEKPKNPAEENGNEERNGKSEEKDAEKTPEESGVGKKKKKAKLPIEKIKKWKIILKLIKSKSEKRRRIG